MAQEPRDEDRTPTGEDVRAVRPDARRSRLRAMLTKIDRDVSRVRRQDTLEDARTALDRLTASWGELVTALALGPEPEVRRCPVCRHLGMRSATRCGYCWTALSPLLEQRRSRGRQRRSEARAAAAPGEESPPVAPAVE